MPPDDALGVDPFERPRAPLGALCFHIREPTSHGAILRPLGQPAPWSRSEPIESWLDPTYQAASEAARSLALGLPQPPRPLSGGAPRANRKDP